jgi:hypothetical protein
MSARDQTAWFTGINPEMALFLWTHIACSQQDNPDFTDCKLDNLKRDKELSKQLLTNFSKDSV